MCLPTSLLDAALVNEKAREFAEVSIDDGLECLFLQHYHMFTNKLHDSTNINTLYTSTSYYACCVCTGENCRDKNDW